MNFNFENEECESWQSVKKERFNIKLSLYIGDVVIDEDLDLYNSFNFYWNIHRKGSNTNSRTNMFSRFTENIDK
ncbi:hypothetical protein GCM10023260_10300 [Bartonella acomydis]|uniref:Uncharacterized protein n=1 Tax=Bartonella acomydis TaxID=686234 RepID=A0ABP9MNE3_9HYPH